MNYVVPDHINEPLHVITPIFNSPRYKTRWKLYHRFAKYVKESGAILHTIEAAFGERADAIPDVSEPTTHPHEGATGSHDHIKLRTSHELWHKERMINLAIQRLPQTWKYVAWIDADVTFVRPNWVGETIHQLQHYQFLQMFSHALDVGPNHEPVGSIRKGFVQTISDGTFDSEDPGYYGGKGASGLAWAARREAIDAIGGLPDYCILGAADWHLAHAMFGLVDKSCPKDMSDEYWTKMRNLQSLCDKHIRKNVGMMPGLCNHYFHGAKSKRFYTDRWRILAENKFTPSVDLKPDWQGLYMLEDDRTDRSIALRDGVRNYFKSRDEDSTEVD